MAFGKGKDEPSERIAFNNLLNYNDGLLVNYIQKQEKISYQEALDEIARFVDALHQEVEGGKEYVVESVGVLYKDSDKHLKMEPLKGPFTIQDSPGIPPRQALPAKEREKVTEQSMPALDVLSVESVQDSEYGKQVEQTEQRVESERGEDSLAVEKVEKIENVEKVEKVEMVEKVEKVVRVENVAIDSMDEVVPAQESPDRSQLDKFNLLKRTIVFFSILITASILVYSMYLNIAAPPLLNTNLVDLPVAESTVYTKNDATVLAGATDGGEQLQAAAGTEAASGKDVAESESGPVLSIKENFPPTASIQNYSIVAGSFGKHENAIQLMEELKSQGYSNAGVFSENDRRHLVFFGTWNNFDEASRHLSAIRLKYGEAWIYNH